MRFGPSNVFEKTKMREFEVESQRNKYFTVPSHAKSIKNDKHPFSDLKTHLEISLFEYLLYSTIILNAL